MTSELHFEKYGNIMFVTSLSLTDQFINKAGGSIRNSKSQDVCHIAFGSRVLGPPPPSGRRNNLRLSSEVGESFDELTQARAGGGDMWAFGRKGRDDHVHKVDLHKFATGILDLKRLQNSFFSVMST